MPPPPAAGRSTGPPHRPAWNGRDHYVCFGERSQRRRWEDARRYGFVSGGGGRWYSRTLEQLRPDHRVFVHIPKLGYVGVGVVTAPVVVVTAFHVEVAGSEIPILAAPLVAQRMGSDADDEELAEHLVRVRWLDTVARDDAFWQPGLFGNQNTVCRLRHRHTLHAVATWFDVELPEGP